MRERRKEIATNDIDCIESDIIKWAKAKSLWENYNLCAHVNFYKDVLLECSLLDIQEKSFDSGMPGGFTLFISVSTANERDAQFEVRKMLRKLIKEKGIRN